MIEKNRMNLALSLFGITSAMAIVNKDVDLPNGHEWKIEDLRLDFYRAVPIAKPSDDRKCLNPSRS